MCIIHSIDFYTAHHFGLSDRTNDSSPLTPEQNRDPSPSASNGHTQEMSPGVCGSEILRYPVLVDCVNTRSEREGCNPGPCSFREVLDRLLSIVKQIIELMLRNCKTTINS
ncbi:e3 ubiquitin-protein ligase MYCBP2 [Caerostris extrusa]|uniref:E3 ubiquitin-protein ligase MYCBP2 n=1 Tax=Caerostris extrusa TaxID=172846 RepID=A0AAV4VFU5_CAEEX|nr:e3 ubiquitin-protein ligase MYCBP2 [Caerostris extrusa]